MSIVISYPHLEFAAGQSPRLHRLPRIRVAQLVMDYLAYGWSVEEMCRHHPYLQPAEAHAAMVYYFDHRAEIEHEIEDELKELTAGGGEHRSPFFLRMRALGRRCNGGMMAMEI